MGVLRGFGGLVFALMFLVCLFWCLRLCWILMLEHGCGVVSFCLSLALMRCLRNSIVLAFLHLLGVWVVVGFCFFVGGFGMV